MPRPTSTQSPIASPSPAGLQAAGGMSLGVSLAVHGVAAFSIVLAFRQPWAEPDEGSAQVVGAQLETFDPTLFDEPVEPPAFIVPIETQPIPKLEPLPPEEYLPLTEWGPMPTPERDDLSWEEIPPDLDPERILQDPELPRPEVTPPVVPAEIEPPTTRPPATEPVAEPPQEATSPEEVTEEDAHDPAVVSPRPVPSDCPPPAYPRLAERRGWTGTVVLLIDVAADGSVTDVKIESSSGYGVLDEAAVTAVRGWRFRPGTLGGDAAALVVRKPIRFGA